MKTVLFACDQNAGRSQIAAALFNAMADPAKARATSAGTQPAAAVHPEVVRLLCEEELDGHLEPPKPLTHELVGRASLLVTMACRAPCPELPSVTREEWPLSDPLGSPAVELRRLREVLRAWVTDLITRNGWGRV
jgi:arsenate reductase